MTAPQSDPMSAMRRPLATFAPKHFGWSALHEGKVGVVTLDRPARKNALTFDLYAELRDLFRDLVYASDIRAIVITGADGNFCSGGDVYEIIEPLTKMAVPELLAFTRMTGDLESCLQADTASCVCLSACLALASWIACQIVNGVVGMGMSRMP